MVEVEQSHCGQAVPESATAAQHGGHGVVLFGGLPSSQSVSCDPFALRHSIGRGSRSAPLRGIQLYSPVVREAHSPPLPHFLCTSRRPPVSCVFVCVLS